MDRILIVEDEQYIREFISLNLARSGFETLEASSGEEGLDILSKNTVDLVLLDVKLPGMDGFQVCRSIRASRPDIAVIMVTARNQDMDKIMGLELGADDYVSKPFNPYELVARIRSVIRRTKRQEPQTEDVLVSGPVKLDCDLHRVFKNEAEIKVTPKEFEILRTLLKRPGHTFDRDQLLNLVWGGDYYGDTKTLDVHIRRLREKIEDDPARPAFIETVWGVGYRWRGVK